MARVSKRMLIWTALGCAGALVADTAVITPLYRVWSDWSDGIAVLKADVERARPLAERRDDLERRHERMREESLTRDAPEAEALVLNRVSEWARAAGLDVSIVQPRWREAADGARMLECRIAGAGTLKAVAEMLHAIETSGLPLRAEETSLTAADERGARIALTLRFSGVALEKESS